MGQVGRPKLIDELEVTRYIRLGFEPKHVAKIFSISNETVNATLRKLAPELLKPTGARKKRRV